MTTDYTIPAGYPRSAREMNGLAAQAGIPVARFPTMAEAQRGIVGQQTDGVHFAHALGFGAIRPIRVSYYVDGETAEIPADVMRLIEENA